MKSGITVYRDINGSIIFNVVVNEIDFPRLDAFDSKLVSECGNEHATAADRLLALECIFRRMQEQN